MESSRSEAIGTCSIWCGVASIAGEQGDVPEEESCTMKRREVTSLGLN